MKFPFKVLMIAIALFFGLTQAFAEEKTFTKPKSGGYRVDWCYKWGSQCGDFAAKRFCKSKGYDDQVDNAIAADIGDVTPTKVMGTGEICDQDICDGFAFITCERADEPDEEEADTKFFSKPLIGGARLNMCYKKNNQCGGNLAAKTFCNKNGFAKALSFGQTQPFTPLIPTRYIGDGKISKELFSIAIKNLTCSD